MSQVSSGRSAQAPESATAGPSVVATSEKSAAGWHSILTFVAIGAAVLLAGTPIFALRMLGGGDIKLLAAACATLGPHFLVTFLLGTILSGGVLGIIYAARSGRLGATFANVRAMMLPMLSGAPFSPIAGDTKMPYGLAILAGALILAGTQLRLPL